MQRIIPLFLFLAALFLAGCLGGSAPQAPTHWLVTPRSTAKVYVQAPKYGVARVGQVNVRPPYDGLKLAVLRPDGTVAFDAFNGFAAAPSALLRGVVQDVAASSGIFTRVVPATSTAATTHTLEVTITRLALDCTKPERRFAVADVDVLLLKGREVVAQESASWSAPTPEGNFSDAFSVAVTTALSDALKAL